MDLLVGVLEHLYALPGLALGRIRQVLSSVHVRPSGVTLRNFPRPTRSYAFEKVDRFDWVNHDLHKVGTMFLTDGTAVAAYALDEKYPGAVPELNNRIFNARRAMTSP